MGSEGFLRYWKVPHSFGKEDSRSILEAAEGSRQILEGSGAILARFEPDSRIERFQISQVSAWQAPRESGRFRTYLESFEEFEYF